MPRRTALYAKLASPRLHRPLARPRLFSLLDEKRGYPVIWLSGPPGSGKTTLAASWKQHARVEGPWYQIDAGDSDPATFFYYLRLALKARAPRAKLPLLTPEYFSDMVEFSRRWFRECFRRLPSGAVCVFDNYHEVAADTVLHRILATSACEVPPGMTVLLISRTPPPAEFIEPLSRDQVTMIGWDDLRLTRAESGAMLFGRGETDPAVADRLHAHCEGWAAGLTLMLERARRGNAVSSLDPEAAKESVFDYFAAQIFRDASEEACRVLLRTAFLPRMTASIARDISGIERAGEILDDLFKRHLFVELRQDDRPFFQYHPLFQMYLRMEARRTLPSAQYQDLMRITARTLADRGLWAEAFDLYAQSAHWSLARALLIQCAPALIRQGRWRTLQEWALRIPESVREENPWAGYWIGRSLLAIDPGAARGLLEKAHAAFEANGEKSSRLLAAASVLEALYYEFADFKAMDPWIDRVAYLLPVAENALPTREDVLMVASNFVMAASYRAPNNPSLTLYVQRTASMLTEPLDDNLRVAAVSMLYAYVVMSLDAQVEATARREAHRLLTLPDVTALRAAFCIVAEGYLHYTMGRHAEALRCFDRCDALAEAHGLKERLSMSRLWRGLTLRRTRRLDEAEQVIAGVLSEPTQPGGQRAAVFALLRASVAHDRAHYQAALEKALLAQDIAEKSGQFNGGTLLVIVTANLAVTAGQYELAERSLQRMRTRVAGPVTENYLAPIALNESWLSHRRGDEIRRDALLREALERADDIKARIRLQWYPNALSELLPVAIARDIERDRATGIAREFGIRPGVPHLEGWPWPVRVYLLGPTKLLVRGEPVRFGRKVPRKTLALLAAIISCGGVSVPEQTVLDLLWPQSDGDAAYRALTTAVRRLRTLLMCEESVRLVGGTLSLDQGTCWCDVWAFENAASGGEAADIGQVLAMYRGTFLEQEDSSWAIPMRERLRAQFTAAIVAEGNRLERVGRHEEALGLYARGLAADELIEAFYQGQMRCYAALGRNGEAVGLYRRFARLFSVSLGIEPSAESKALCEGLCSG